MTLDDSVQDEFLKPDNPTGEAIKSLLNVKGRKKGEVDTEVETKTDLDLDDVKIHTNVDLLSSFLEFTPEDFASHNVLSQLVTKKERKLISKDRLSRREIVEVARAPEMMPMGGDSQNNSWFNRWFKSRRQPRQDIQ